MEKLITIQKREKLNDVYAVDEKGNGGANHRYIVSKSEETIWTCGNNTIGVLEDIQFQNGPILMFPKTWATGLDHWRAV